MAWLWNWGARGALRRGGFSAGRRQVSRGALPRRNGRVRGGRIGVDCRHERRGSDYGGRVLAIERETKWRIRRRGGDGKGEAHEAACDHSVWLAGSAAGAGVAGVCGSKGADLGEDVSCSGRNREGRVSGRLPDGACSALLRDSVAR